MSEDDWPEGGHAVLGVFSNVRREGDSVVADFTPIDSWGPRWRNEDGTMHGYRVKHNGEWEWWYVPEGTREPSESYPDVEGPVVTGPVVEPPVRPRWPVWDYFQRDPGDEDDKD